MANFGIWITGEQILNGWRTGHEALYRAVMNGLAVYQDIDGTPEKIQAADFERTYRTMKHTRWFFSELIFNVQDVAAYEAEHQIFRDATGSGVQDPKSGEDGQAGILHRAIEATVTAVLYFQRHREPPPHEAFHAFIQERFSDLPNAIVDMIEDAAANQCR